MRFRPAGSLAPERRPAGPANSLLSNSRAGQPRPAPRHYGGSNIGGVRALDLLHRHLTEHGLTDRIIVGATGSKMQTVGTAFFKLMRPDAHIDYPLPDSYFPGSLSKGIYEVWEIVFQQYAETAQQLTDWEKEHY